MLRKLCVLMANPREARATALDRRRRRFVSRLECLEDRAVPSTFTVTTTLDSVAADAKMSLREAINSANAHPGADTVVLPAGVYRLTRNGADNTNAAGDLDVTGSTLFRGAGAGATIVDGRQLDRVFDVRGTAPHSINVTFQGLTIRNGRADQTGGGGIRVGQADLVVQDCVVTANRTSGAGAGISNAELPGTGNVTLVRSVIDHNIAAEGGGVSVQANSQNLGSVLTVTGGAIRRNTARDGGGILASRAALINATVSGNHASVGNGGGLSVTAATLTSSTVSGNSAAILGGGIYGGAATLTNCIVSGNSANSNVGGIPGADGGGIFAVTATLTNSTVSGNFGAGGGGIEASVVTLTNSSVSNNTATTSGGGGIVANRATLTGSTVSGNHAASDGGGIRVGIAVTLTNCTVSGNAGENGGGILDFGTATLTNSTVSGNHAVNLGGGIFSFGLALLNDTVTDNDAHTGGGIFQFKSGGGTATVRNTIIAQNQVDIDGAAPDVSGAFISGGHNLIGDGTGGTGLTNGVNGDQVGTDADPIDPGLAPLANNGGSTMTHALLAGSTAIDRGDNSGAPATDQRGVARPRDGDGNGSRIVDIGAFER